MKLVIEVKHKNKKSTLSSYLNVNNFLLDTISGFLHIYTHISCN